MSFKLNCFSLNVRGIRDLTKRKALFLFCKSKCRDVCFLQETHSVVKDESFWSNQWGSKIIYCHGSNNSAGVMILFNQHFNYTVLESHCSDEGRWLIIVIQFGESIVILANVYGFNRSSLNNCLFTDLTSKLISLKTKYPFTSLIMGGDFNETPDLCYDRFPPKYGTTTDNKIISDICSSLSLVDIHRFLHNDSSPSFTWFKSDLTQKSRIDFWLISDNLISISNAPLTDHAGIELEISDLNYNLFRKPGYWKLNNSLLHNSNYCLGIKGIIDSF